MPTINIFYEDENLYTKIEGLLQELRQYVAKELTGVNIKLDVSEVSARVIKSKGGGMLAPYELEITAAAFRERVDNQDQICLNIQKFLKNRINSDVNVWLILSELGHSWE